MLRDYSCVWYVRASEFVLGYLWCISLVSIEVTKLQAIFERSQCTLGAETAHFLTVAAKTCGFGVATLRY